MYVRVCRFPTYLHTCTQQQQITFPSFTTDPACMVLPLPEAAPVFFFSLPLHREHLKSAEKCRWPGLPFVEWPFEFPHRIQPDARVAADSARHHNHHRRGAAVKCSRYVLSQCNGGLKQHSPSEVEDWGVKMEEAGRKRGWWVFCAACCAQLNSALKKRE
jgi:hypothetical protein